MEKYYLDIDLRRWAIIQYASRIWKRPDLKQHLLDTIEFEIRIDITWTMPTELHEELDKLILPDELKYELKFAVGSMGTRIRKWMKSLFWDNQSFEWEDLLDYFDHIHWNHLGCIDSRQTAESIYNAGLLAMSYDTWKWLCRNCVEDCIVDFWETISDDEYSDLKQTICTIDLKDDEYILDYWRLRMQNQMDRFVESRNDLEDGLSLDEYMFTKYKQTVLTMLPTRYRQTYRYFWHRFSDDQKKSALSQSLGDDNLFEANEDIDDIMFVLRQCLLYNFGEAANNVLEWGWMLPKMLRWQYRDNFILTLEESLCQCGYAALSIDIVIMAFEEKIYVGQESKVREWFYHLWQAKDIGDFREAVMEFAIPFICQLEFMELLEYVVIHQSSWWKTKNLFTFIIKYFQDPSPLPGRDKGDFEFLRQFIEKVLQFDWMREWFERKLIESEIFIYGDRMLEEDDE